MQFYTTAAALYDVKTSFYVLTYLHLGIKEEKSAALRCPVRMKVDFLSINPYQSIMISHRRHHA